MHRFQVIPIFLRTAAAGDILLPTIGNISTFPGLRVVVDEEVRFPVLTNVSVFSDHPLAVVVGTVANIVLPAINNVSTFPTLVIGAAPPDETIWLPTIANASTFPTLVVDEAPADADIRFPTFTNVSTFPPLAVNPDEAMAGDDENDPMIGGGSIGGRMI